MIITTGNITPLKLNIQNIPILSNSLKIGKDWNVFFHFTI